MHRLWLDVSLLAPPRGQEVLLVDALRRAGARLVERDGDRIRAHVLAPAGAEPTPAAAAPLLRRIEAAVRASTTMADASLSWRWRDEPPEPLRVDGPGVQRVGERLAVVRGTAGHDDGAAAGRLLIRLHPGVAFGGVEHPTTRACLRRLETLVRPGDRLVDIGAGSGILSIAAALLGAERVLALEADAEASEEAGRNVAHNRVARTVRVRRETVGPRQLRRLRGYDGVIANLQAEILRPLLQGLARVTRPGGWLLISGVTRPEQPDTVRAAEGAGLSVLTDEWDQGWWTATLRCRGG